MQNCLITLFQCHLIKRIIELLFYKGMWNTMYNGTILIGKNNIFIVFAFKVFCIFSIKLYNWCYMSSGFFE